MKKITFDEEELYAIAVFHIETREKAIAGMEKVLGLMDDDPEMKALIVAHGGKNSGSVSGKTSFLLAGEKAGPEKLKKAESLGVKVIDETEFRRMIGVTKEETQETTLF